MSIQSCSGPRLEISYLATRPETVFSLVSTGQFPPFLPSYLSENRSFSRLDPTPKKSIVGMSTLCRQVFIIELAIPSGSITPPFLPEMIRKVYVCSEVAKKLFQNLTQGLWNKPILVHPDFFSPSNVFQIGPTTHTHRLCPLKDESPLSTHRLLKRLVSFEEHMEVLRFGLKSAKKTVLITTYGTKKSILESQNILSLMIEAKKRGVKIYVYDNQEREIHPETAFLFKQHGIWFSQAYTHSKILAIDQSFVAVGSFNWLGTVKQNGEYPRNSSFAYKGDGVGGLIDSLWFYFMHYRDLQFRRMQKAEEAEKKPSFEEKKSFPLLPDTTLIYLPTLMQHSHFIKESFDLAKKRILIVSPFISHTSAKDFDEDLLRKTAMRGVEIIFVTLKEQIKEVEFDKFIERVNSKNVHLIGLENIHLKTYIVDDTLISEGSFNWLSASRDWNSIPDHEATLAVQGVHAKDLIEEFYETSVYQEIMSHLI